MVYISWKGIKIISFLLWQSPRSWEFYHRRHWPEVYCLMTMQHQIFPEIQKSVQHSNCYNLSSCRVMHLPLLLKDALCQVCLKFWFWKRKILKVVNIFILFWYYLHIENCVADLFEHNLTFFYPWIFCANFALGKLKINVKSHKQ